MFSKRHVLLLDSAKPSEKACQLDLWLQVRYCLSVQDGSSMRLIAPLMQAEERWTMNE